VDSSPKRRSEIGGNTPYAPPLGQTRPTEWPSTRPDSANRVAEYSATRSIGPSTRTVGTTTDEEIPGPAEYEPPPAPDDDLNLTDVDFAYWRRITEEETA
jgi:hypothetical protein